MTFFREPVRLPQRTTDPARRRRSQGAFQPYGGDGALRITHVFTNAGLSIESINTGDQVYIVCRPATEVQTNLVVIGESTAGGGSLLINDSGGNERISITDEGAKLPEVNKDVITGNASLSSTQINQVLSINSASNATITLPTDANTLIAGTWIALVDISGNASNNAISVNPASYVSGIDLDGSADAQKVLNTDYGTTFLRVVKTDANGSKQWVAETGSGLKKADWNFAGEVSVNTAMQVGDTLIAVNTNAGDVRVTLPDVTKYNGRPVFVKKTTLDSNYLRINTVAGQFIEVNKTEIASNQSKRGVTLVGDGIANWYSCGADRTLT